MLEKILLSQHECVIMGNFNLRNIDWTLQRSTPAPGNKLMQLLNCVRWTTCTSHNVHETTRQNNILDRVLSSEEELIEELIRKNLKISDKIEDHQAITFSMKKRK